MCSIFSFNKVLRTALLCWSLIGMGTLIACSASGYAGDVTETEWNNRTIWQILDRQDPAPADLQHYIDENQFSENRRTAAYVALVQLFGPAHVRNVEQGATQLAHACDKGEPRACRPIGRQAITSTNPQYRAQGADMLDAACSAGILMACQDLAVTLAQGYRLPFNGDRAVIYAEKSCRAPLEEHCVYSAASVQYIKTEFARAIFEESCKSGTLIGCQKLAKFHLDETIDQLDVPLSLSLLDSNCSTGYAESCESLFYHLSVQEDQTQRYVESEAIAQGLCHEGQEHMCTRMASYYSDEVMQKPKLSFEMSKRGCELGEEHACKWLGQKYLAGNGTPKDLAKAKAVFDAFCASGDKGSCHVAAQALEGTETLSPTERSATQCESGYADACRNAAWAYATGKDVQKDLARAVTLFETGCDKGLAISCIDLASLYDYAQFDMPEDKPRAQILYGKACRLGEQQGCRLQN